MINHSPTSSPTELHRPCELRSQLVDVISKGAGRHDAECRAALSKVQHAIVVAIPAQERALLLIKAAHLAPRDLIELRTRLPR